MKLNRTIASICTLLIVAGAAQAQTLLGEWNFQTAVGTTSTNGVSVDIIGNGVLRIARNGKGLAASIAWVDDSGRVTSTRKVDGSDSGVFTHTGARVTSGRSGKEVSTEVRIVYTLQAQGDVLTGQRLVETDEDEPKPVTGTRITARNPSIALAPLAEPSTAPHIAPERGPSTPAERARVVQMAQDAEKNPQLIQARDGAWLDDWVNDIPDLSFNNSALASWLSAVVKGEARALITFQYKASVMAFQINHPTLAETQSANDLAGLEGVLRAYEVLRAAKPSQRNAKLEMALAAREQKQLPAFLMQVAGRDPE